MTFTERNCSHSFPSDHAFLGTFPPHWALAWSCDLLGPRAHKWRWRRPCSNKIFKCPCAIGCLCSCPFHKDNICHIGTLAKVLQIRRHRMDAQSTHGFEKGYGVAGSLPTCRGQATLSDNELLLVKPLRFRGQLVMPHNTALSTIHNSAVADAKGKTGALATSDGALHARISSCDTIPDISQRHMGVTLVLKPSSEEKRSENSQWGDTKDGNDEIQGCVITLHPGLQAYMNHFQALYFISPCRGPLGLAHLPWLLSPQNRRKFW